MRNSNVLTLAASVLSIALGFVTSILLARFLGPAGRGEVAAIQLWPMLLPALTMTGFMEALVVFVARRSSDAAKVLGTTLCMSALVSVLVLPLGLIFMPVLLSSQSDWVVRISQYMLVYVPVVMFVDSYAELLRSRMLIGAYNVQRLIEPVGLPIVMTLLLAFHELSVLNVIASQVALLVVRLVAILVLFSRMRVGITPIFEAALFSPMLSFAARSHVGVVASFVNTRMGQVLIAAFLAPSQLGLYVVALSTTSVITVLSQSLRITILPKIALETDRNIQIKTLVRWFGMFWTVTIFSTPVLALSLVWLIPSVYGKDFSDAVMPAIVMALSSTLVGAKELLASGAKAMGLPWLGSKAELLAMGFSLVFLLILIQPLGILGAALASAIASVVSILVVVMGLRGQIGVRGKDLFLPNSEILDVVKRVFKPEA